MSKASTVNASKSSSRNPEQTRALLLEAAFKEIYEVGFQAASLERILANTKVTKGALYHHFPNKQALGLAVIREVVKTVTEEQFIGPLQEGTDPVSALLDMIDSRISAYDRQEMVFGSPLNNLIQEMSPLDEDFRKRLLSIVENARRTVADALRRGQANENVKPEVNSDEAAVFIVACMEGALGLSKAYLAPETYCGCMEQLKQYIRSLAI